MGICWFQFDRVCWEMGKKELPSKNWGGFSLWTNPFRDHVPKHRLRLVGTCSGDACLAELLQLRLFLAHVGGTAPGNTSVFVVDLGWGGAGMLTFMSTFSQLRCHATTYPRALGWGGVGWGRDVNVHVKLFSTGMLRYNLPPCTFDLLGC